MRASEIVEISEAEARYWGIAQGWYWVCFDGDRLLHKAGPFETMDAAIKARRTNEPLVKGVNRETVIFCAVWLAVALGFGLLLALRALGVI